MYTVIVRGEARPFAFDTVNNERYYDLTPNETYSYEGDYDTEELSDYFDDNDPRYVKGITGGKRYMPTEFEEIHGISVKDVCIQKLKDNFDTDGSNRIELMVKPCVREALQTLLYQDERFRSIGYSEFIMMAIICADRIIED